MPEILDDPVRQIDARVAAARLAFAQDVDALLDELERQWPHIFIKGETFRALRVAILDRFAERARFVEPLPDPLLRQLVREAYEHFADPESLVDMRDWLRTAARIIGPTAAVGRREG